jgi:hypothetical protein
MKGPEMLKYLIAAAALLVAGVPAYLGLTSNASFSRDLPVRVPEQAQVVIPTQAAAPTRTPTPTRATDDDGTPDQGRGEVEAGDDHGDDNGDVPRDDRTEIGDDHGGDVPRDDRTEAGDDRDGTSGRDDSDSHSGSDDSGSDDSGHGSDDGPGHD